MAAWGDQRWRPFPRPREWAVIVAALVVVAGLVRFAGLGSLDAWQDEVYTFIPSIDPWTKLVTWETEQNQSDSPLSFLEVKISRQIFGHSNFGLRAVAAFYGVACVVAMYLVLGRVIGYGPSLGAAIFLCLDPMAIEHSRQARMYSPWLFATLLMIALAWETARHALADDRPSAVDWRFWLLGFAFMYVHAEKVIGLYVVAAAVVWLVGVGVARFPVDRDRAWVLIRGTALSCGVFVSSWSLTGIGKAFYWRELSKRQDPATTSAHVVFHQEFLRALRALGGYQSSVSLVLWLIAVAGLAALAIRNRTRSAAAAVLVVMVGIAPWMAFGDITRIHVFEPRYVYPMLIMLSAGVGVAGWGLWREGVRARPSHVMTRRVLLVCLAMVVIALWMPGLREIYRVPKQSLGSALAPIVANGRGDESVVLAPPWYWSLDQWYDLGAPQPARGPAEARENEPANAPRGGGGRRDYALDLEAALASRDAAKLPPAVWVVLFDDPIGRAEQMSRLFAAYEVNDDAHRKQLVDAAVGGAITLTARISRGRIDYVTVTYGRHVATD